MRYADRLIVWNNGQLPDEWTVERLTRKHPSQPYNRDIANAFFRAGMIDAIFEIVKSQRDY